MEGGQQQIKGKGRWNGKVKIKSNTIGQNENKYKLIIWRLHAYLKKKID